MDPTYETVLTVEGAQSGYVYSASADGIELTWEVQPWGTSLREHAAGWFSGSCSWVLDGTLDP